MSDDEFKGKMSGVVGREHARLNVLCNLRMKQF